jgi:hypothetical protein
MSVAIVAEVWRGTLRCQALKYVSTYSIEIPNQLSAQVTTDNQGERYFMSINYEHVFQNPTLEKRCGFFPMPLFAMRVLG